jgi:prepilin-type N-terminal cleavage/methylation domain-containing protein
MKTPPQSLRCASPTHDGFSLLEIIGVLAVMAILATALAPNLIRTLDRANVKAETGTLEVLAQQLENYVRDTGALPVHGAAASDPRVWAVTLAAYSGLNAAELTRNRQSVVRGYLVHSSGDRAMVISGLRSGLTVPSGTTINDAQFQQIWDTPTGQVPPVSSWATWSTWSGYPDMLVIQRVNVLALRRTSTAILNNADVLAVTVSYRIRALDGTLSGATVITPATQRIVPALRRGERVELYANATGAGTPIYTHVVADHDVSLTYDSGFWR